MDSLAAIFLSPLLGSYVDKYGKRLHLCALSAVGLVAGLTMLLRRDVVASPVWAVAVLVLSSSSPTLVKSAVPLLTSKREMPAAYAILYALENVTAGMCFVIVGRMQEVATAEGANGAFDSSLRLLIGIALAALACAFVLLRHDKGALNRPPLSRSE